ncbi:2Fe-2S iron-sulfur cluster-binding protein [Crocosphaera sp. XPORK-15E]|uniref:2Fe-2S iron-sulfur cluster-binding protein n=1 Tax=Crocosphaera sp. XPORK-15E TaxID=3110247 RepID=UPI002B2181F5|nr:2Fe-2S iron-sulfur cluster-binding protein [Crocosphaera sp. XPORK-15E]MEA5532610.1 2Fe-2S iron-sulfur cluster-binding protein [Crocosphaera sp. XPORK-15E]
MNNHQKEFSVTLINPNNQTKQTIMVAEDQVILDKAKEQGMDLPACCCAAACTVCTGKVLEGTVQQTAQAVQFLGYPLVDAGYVLTCAAYPTSNCTILTYQEEEIF